MKKFLLLLIVFCTFSIGVYAQEALFSPVNPDYINYKRDKEIEKYFSFSNKFNKNKETQKVTGYVPAPFKQVSTWIKPSTKRGTLPTYYDLRTYGRVSPIRNQNPWGTCWAFATLASVESAILTQNPFSTVYYSALHMANTSGFNTYDPLDTGGQYLMSSAYLSRFSGPVAEKDNPYKSPWTSPSYPLPIQAYLEEVSFMPIESDTGDSTILNADGTVNEEILDVIKDAVVTNGAVEFSYGYYTNYSIETQTKANYYCQYKYTVNHSVAIVGWDDNYSKSNFKTAAPGNGAFLVRNSWGTSWGEAGYFWLSYYDRTARDYASFNKVTTDLTKYDKIYYHNFGGMVASFSSTQARNIYTMEEDSTVKAVATFVAYGGVDYTLNLYTQEGSGPFIKVYSDANKFGYAGYITIPLKTSLSIKKGIKLIIEMDYDSKRVILPDSSGNGPFVVPVEMNDFPAYNLGTYLPGRSYAYLYGSWTDMGLNYNANTSLRALVSLNPSKVNRITVEPKTIDLEPGQEYQYIATVYPTTAINKQVSWTSTNTDIATVSDSGMVTAIAPGTCQIRATAKDGSGVSDVGTLNVVGVIISPKEITLDLGVTRKFEATIIPATATNKTIIWSSSNPSVATVDKYGFVTTKSKGVTYISATTALGGYSDTAKVTVNSGIVPVKGVTIDPETIGLAAGDTFDLSANITPVNATNQNVTWESSNSFVASVDSDGVVTAYTYGTCQITVKTVDGNYSDICTVTVSDSSASIKVTGIKIIPNSLIIHDGDVYQLNTDITPSNATNKKVIWTSSNPSVCSVDTSGKVKALAPGRVAIITATTEDGGKVATSRVLIQNSK